MKFDSQQLSGLLAELERSPVPDMPPKNLQQFLQKNAPRITALVDRGWPLDELLQRMVESQFAGQAPSLRTLRRLYQTAAPSKRKKRAPRPEKTPAHTAKIDGLGGVQ